MSTTFTQDLQFENELIEKIFIKQNFSNAHSLFIIKDYFKFFDVVFIGKTGSVTTVEVKIDRLATKTGNIALEYGYNGKLSGIEVSTSDCYCFVIEKTDNYELNFIKTSELKRIIAETEHRIVKGGDNKSADIHLLPLTTIYDSLVKQVEASK